MTADEHRDEVRDACVSQDVLAYALELAMNDLTVQQLELAGDVVFCLLHPLLERCVNRISRQGPGLLVESGRPILTSRRAGVKPPVPSGAMRP